MQRSSRPHGSEPADRPRSVWLTDDSNATHDQSTYPGGSASPGGYCTTPISSLRSSWSACPTTPRNETLNRSVYLILRPIIVNRYRYPPDHIFRDEFISTSTHIIPIAISSVQEDIYDSQTKITDFLYDLQELVNLQHDNLNLDHHSNNKAKQRSQDLGDPIISATSELTSQGIQNFLERYTQQGRWWLGSQNVLSVAKSLGRKASHKILSTRRQIITSARNSISSLTDLTPSQSQSSSRIFVLPAEKMSRHRWVPKITVECANSTRLRELIDEHSMDGSIWFSSPDVPLHRDEVWVENDDYPVLAHLAHTNAVKTLANAIGCSTEEFRRHLEEKLEIKGAAPSYENKGMA